MLKGKGRLQKLQMNSILLALMILISLFGPFGQTASAYTQSLGDVISATVNGDILTIVVDNGYEPNDDIIEIQVCENDILKVNYRPNGIASSPSTPIIDPDRTWESVGAQINTSGNPITITTSEMQIEIKRYPCRMTVKKADGTVLFWEPDDAGVFYEGVRFVRNPNHNMYGVHSYACFEGNGEILRNDATRAVQAGQQGNSGGPFIWSSAGYGLLVDSDGGYSVVESDTEKLEFYYGNSTEEGRRYYKDNVEYYIMLGEPESIMENFMHITGQSPMMPEWSLGFSNYEWGINQDELYDMIETYRAKNIPLDSYGIDYDWKQYGEDNYGEFVWNTNNFPQAASTQLKTNMDELGVKLIGITKPRIVTEFDDGTPTVQGIDAANGDYFYPGHYSYQDYFFPVTVRSIDPYKSTVRDWWWNHSIDAFNKGIAGWWNDETDTVASGFASYWFGNYTTLHLSQALYEGQRDYTDDSVRVWQTGRNYYPGTQRYATTVWSGDVGTQFAIDEHIWWTNGLNDQKSVMLSTINNGQMKWGSDGGGFNQNSGTTENPSPELYSRWLQLASVSPVFRVHGNFNHQRQPWYYGMTAEESSKAAIQFRYSLMPYIYSYEYKAYEKGVGLVKPLLFDYPDDPNTANYVDAWMFGDWLLVSPVTERYQTSKWIYLPEGHWVDYATGLVYTGGQYIQYAVNGETWSDMPMFIKEGAIIPSQKVLDYTSEEAITQIDIDVFASGTESSFALYDDDGVSYDYENGAFFKQIISAQDNGSAGIQVSLGAKTGSYLSSYESYILKIHGKAAQGVTSNQNQLTKYNDLYALKAAAGEGFATGKDIYGDVTYVKVFAGQAKNIIATGSAAVSSNGYLYEAEEASLWGDTMNTQAGSANNHSGYTGWGFADGFGNHGAAVTFYANVKTAGEYPVDVRYANGGSSKKMSIYVNGIYAGPLDFASTGSWDSWEESEKMLSLAAGSNAITIQCDTSKGDTGQVNIDSLYVPFYPNLQIQEAETAALLNGAVAATDHWYYSGAGFVSGLEAVGAAVEYRSIVVPSSGSYDIALRYANGNQTTKTLNVYVNGNYFTTASLSSPGGNWNLWNEWTASLPLQAGANRISFRFDTGSSGYVNLDSLSVSIGAQDRLPENKLDNAGFERPTGESSNWTEWHPSGQSVAYGIDEGIGVNPLEAAKEGDQRAYFHLGSAYQQSIHQVVNVESGLYTVGFWAKHYNNSAYTARAEIAVPGQATVFIDLPFSSEWNYYTTDVYVNGAIDVGFYVNSPGGTTVLIDAVNLVKK